MVGVVIFLVISDDGSDGYSEAGTELGRESSDRLGAGTAGKPTEKSVSKSTEKTNTKPVQKTARKPVEEVAVTSPDKETTTTATVTRYGFAEMKRALKINVMVKSVQKMWDDAQ